MSILRLLIANRGEIACRIIRTARRMGIHTIAIYAEPDANALHVQQADEAWALEGSDPAESYLSIRQALSVAKSSNADAIHPGYGFLSENAEFARACQKENITFIGPPAEAIARMGSKSAAKTLMEAAGVPMVPGYHGDDQSPDTLRREAERIGYPVLLKASAGGGGKGMRIVREASAFESALEAARRESRGAFGNDHMLVEKYLENPRHVEVQILSDSAGNTRYIHDRDCSIQRRHQKIIEEAPAPNIPDDVRIAMGEAAVRCAEAIHYLGAGTIEFLYDGSDQFYFMEMNTRLQVEHPVTEMISGLDLVEWQLRIADGQCIPFQQADIPRQGHALEVRIYAENPHNNFLPASGQIRHLRFPESTRECRIDTGIGQGDTVSPFYDPMIAKMITWGEHRDDALRRMTTCLQKTEIGGITTNVSFLAATLTHPEFVQANLSTLFIERHQNELLQSPEPAHSALIIAATSYLYSNLARPSPIDGKTDPWSPWQSKDLWRLNHESYYEFELTCLNQLYPFRVKLERVTSDQIAGRLYGNDLVSSFLIQTAQDGVILHTDTWQRTFTPCVDDQRILVFDEGHVFSFDIVHLEHGAHHEAGEGELTAPMHGKIVDVLAQAGQTVQKGDPLIVLEAMKMEHVIHAHSDGVVERICYHTGDRVEEGALLIELKGNDK